MSKLPKSLKKTSIWKLGLSLPWSNNSSTTIDVSSIATNDKYPTDRVVLADVINVIAQAALYIGGVLMFFWAVWGVFDYIRAEGNKEALAKARKKIQWAVAGFIILILAFFISDFLQPILVGGPINRQIEGLTF